MVHAEFVRREQCPGNVRQTLIASIFVLCQKFLDQLVFLVGWLSRINRQRQRFHDLGQIVLLAQAINQVPVARLEPLS
jgi:hypothetical protein